VPTAVRLLLALACALVAGGCGAAGQDASAHAGDPTTPAPSAPSAPAPTASPADGPAVTGSGYTFHLPHGWRDITSKLRRRSGVDHVAGALTAVGGFRSNVSVVVKPGGLSAPQVATVTRTILDRMRASAPHDAMLPPTTVAGSPAGHLAGLSHRATRPYWLEQYVVGHGDHTYVLSFAFSPKVSASERRATIDSMLASWSWR
jgi:hypothetical protein